MDDARPRARVDVFVEWPGRLRPGDTRSVAEVEAAACFELRQARWLDSAVAEAEGRKLCHYRAPDAESVRQSFRQGGVDIDAVWSGTVRDTDDPLGANVVVERWFEAPLDFADAVAIVGTMELLPRGYRLLRAIQPCGRERILCLCEAPVPPALPRERIGEGLLIWSCRMRQRQPPAAQDKPL